MRVAKLEEIRIYVYEPKPDITAYELAELIRIVLMKGATHEELAKKINDLPPMCRRHIAERKIFIEPRGANWMNRLRDWINRNI
jgi:hypothetical protein